MGQIGRQVFAFQTGQALAVSADGSPERQQAITLNWDLFAAVGSDTTLPDDNIVLNGQKYARYGQVFTKVTQGEINVVDFSGDDDPTGGAATLTIAGAPPGGPDFSEALEDVAYNISAAALQTAIRALTFPGAGKVTVTKSGFAYTITFPPESGNITIAGDTTNGGSGGFTGGGGDTFLITSTPSTSGLAYGGLYGPYDSGATDGRQTISQGNVCISNRTVLQSGGLPGLTPNLSNYPDVLVGGRIYVARVLANNAAASLAAGPLWSALIAAMPRLVLVGQY